MSIVRFVTNFSATFDDITGTDTAEENATFCKLRSREDCGICRFQRTDAGPLCQKKKRTQVDLIKRFPTNPWSLRSGSMQPNVRTPPFIFFSEDDEEGPSGLSFLPSENFPLPSAVDCTDFHAVLDSFRARRERTVQSVRSKRR